VIRILFEAKVVTLIVILSIFQTSKQKVAEVYEKYSVRVANPNYIPGEGVIIDIARRNRFSPALTAKLGVFLNNFLRPLNCGNMQH
jgi:hypothetical protein